MCRKSHGISDKVKVEVTRDNGERVDTPTWTSTKHNFRFSKSDPSISESSHEAKNETRISEKTSIPDRPSATGLKAIRRHKISLSFSPTSIPNTFSRSYDPNADSALLNLTMEDFQRQFSGEPNLSEHKEEGDRQETDDDEEDTDLGLSPSSPEHIFRPLLLFIPLRLGQEKFNMEYAEALKACFTLPQTVGVIGGKPRHALWFIGHHNNHLLYFDPHTNQPFVPMNNDGVIPDETYHVKQPDRIPINELDPSLALGFFCKDEADIDDLCKRLKSEVLSKMSYMFELTLHRPPYWGPPDSAKHMPKEPFILLEPDSLETDEGFEIVEWPYPAPTPEKGTWPHPSV